MLKRIALSVIAVLLATGCYMPVRFDAEVTLDRTGYYTMIFDGYLAEVSLWEDLRKGKLQGAEEQNAVSKYLKDLKRDRSVTEVSYVRDGIYRVHWETEGDILRAKFITFLRRNENMFSLRYVKDEGTVTLAGASLTQEQRQQLTDIGLGMQGELRLITNARVIGGNADRSRDWPDSGPGYRMYIWEIPNIFRATPQLVIQLHD